MSKIRDFEKECPRCGHLIGKEDGQCDCGYIFPWEYIEEYDIRELAEMMDDYPDVIWPILYERLAPLIGMADIVTIGEPVTYEEYMEMKKGK